MNALQNDAAAAYGARRRAQSSDAIYRSTKTYDHSEGLSCCFRQWRAQHSHCCFVHGYALAFRFVFATRALDERNWCFDFGGLKPVRAWLHEMFDHTMIAAQDDPQLAHFQAMQQAGLVQLRVLPAVGCEATAQFVFGHVSAFLFDQTLGRVWLESVEVSEHGGNSAIYTVADAPFGPGGEADLHRIWCGPPPAQSEAEEAASRPAIQEIA